MRLTTLTLPVLLTAIAACASTPGAKPHDMSVAQHEQMARRDEKASEGHLAQFDPKARTEATTCGGKANQTCRCLQTYGTILIA